MKIVGLDVCKDSVVAWVLESVPRNFRQHFKEHKRREPDESTFKANAEGIAGLLALKPDAVIMEPTGVHYSWIWSHICQVEGIEVLWVGHQEAVHYRKQYKLPDKNDQADALALAAYGLTHWQQQEFFLEFEPGKVAKLRECWLQLQSLNRIRNPVVNRARQQLAREFPEAALKESDPSKTDGMEPLWSWLAGRERNLKKNNFYYDKLYAKSIAKVYGVEISHFTRRLANHICDLRDWEIELEIQMLEILADPKFAPYRAVMTNFGLGNRPQALLISQIYPISKFESLGRLKRRLGMAKDENSSGDKETMNTGNGSKLCRSQLYMWILDRIAPQKARPKNEIGEKLGSFYDERNAQFQDNPELWKQKTIVLQQERALRDFKENLQKSLLPIMTKEMAPQVEAMLNLTMQTMQISLAASAEKLAPGAKSQEVKRGFGKLVISQTAAYGCRLLFKELKKAIQ